MVRYPPLALCFTKAHLHDTPFCNMSRDSCPIPHKNKHFQEFCDTIAASIARYEKYRYWASKSAALLSSPSPFAARNTTAIISLQTKATSLPVVDYKGSCKHKLLGRKQTPGSCKGPAGGAGKGGHLVKHRLTEGSI